VKQGVVLVVEDVLSEAVMRKVIATVGPHLEIDRPIVTRGASGMRGSVPKYLTASRALPHILVADLDSALCPSALRAEWRLGQAPDRLLFNVAVREIEAWLLADHEGIAGLLGIARNRVPVRPELEGDPKRSLVNLARRCRNRRLRDELIPAQGSANQIGPVYNARMSQFVTDAWNLERACAASPSLARAVDRIRAFAT
jgi:hypothetical protein